MDSTTQIILAAISGGILQAIFPHLLSKKKERRIDLEIIINTFSEQNKRLKVKEEWMKKVNDFMVEISDIKRKITLLEAQQLTRVK